MSSFWNKKSPYKYINSFKAKPLEFRKAESEKIISKYSDRIPIIVDVQTADIPLDKNKYLVPKDITIGQFMYIIRKRCKLAPEKALFLFINNSLPPSSAIISTVYKTNVDEDGFLYINLNEETTFG